MGVVIQVTPKVPQEGNTATSAGPSQAESPPAVRPSGMQEPWQDYEATGQILNDSILLQLIHLGTVLERKLTEQLSNYDVTPSELSIMAVCRENPRCTAVMIAQMVPVETPSISRSVHRLVQRGLLARRRSREDRRQVLLWITDEGDSLINQLLAPIHEVELDVFQGLNQEQCRFFAHYAATLLGKNFPPKGNPLC